MPSRISQMRNEPQQQQQIQQSQPQLNETYINQLKALMNSKNASQYLSQIAAQNPQINQIFQLVRSGQNPRLVFEFLARQRGVDPNSVVNKLID